MSTSGPATRTHSRRPHRAARLEDRWTGVVAHRLAARGWVPRIEPYTGYGMPGWVRVFGRALLAPPGTTAGEATERGDEADQRAVRGWRSFFTAQIPRAEVEVTIAGATTRLVADRGGYIDSVVEADLAPGWQEVTLTLGGRSVLAPVLVVSGDQQTAVVSDIDDTVMVTALPRPMLAAWNALVLHQNARRVVPGMAELYRRWEAAHPGTPTFYLSTGAWNVAPALRRFLRRYGYPAGPLLLTDWGPTNTGWFRSGQQHKMESLRRLMDELPQVSWLLVGDDGQHDPQIYGDIALEFPDRVSLIAIRELTTAEQLLAHGTPAPVADDDAAERPDTPPVLHGGDGYELALRMIDAGVL